MDYPYPVSIKAKNIFGDNSASFTIYSGLTTFVGTNASGKTQTLKALRDEFKKTFGNDKVRYLSSNRLGTMEQYRSRTDQHTYNSMEYSVGDRRAKKVRHEIETASGDFFTLDDRKDVYIKVAERLSVLFKRHIYIRWDAGQMRVFFEKSGSENEYSVTAEASGLVNIISILAALFDETIEMLLIDEPEVSLHPQLQSYLLREMYIAAREYRKTIIISTHSAEMIQLGKATDLCNCIFFSAGELPKQINPESPELEGKQLRDFLVRMSLIYTEAFFAKKVLLIEGASDMIMCRYLSNRLNLSLDVAGSQIIPIDGKGQFAVVTKLFRLIGKETCILTDLDGFTDDNSVLNLFSALPKATAIANEYGSSDLQGMIRSIKTSIEELISANKASITKIYEVHQYWINRDTEIEEDKTIRRAVIAQLLSSNQAELSNWPNSAAWVSLKVQMEALFGILEKLGCFILRKGTIESYYSLVPNTSYIGKPSAAALEVAELDDKTEQEISNQYFDLVRALKYAALDEIIDESFAVKKELYSELALVLGVLHNTSTEKELLSSIKQAKGNSESLFSYRILSENERAGVEVLLRSAIIDVDGFPFKAFIGDNVNQIIDSNVCSKTD